MIERIATVRHKDGSITIKPFFGEDFDTAEQAARDWLNTIQSAYEFIAIEYEQFFLLSIENFVQRPADEDYAVDTVINELRREL